MHRTSTKTAALRLYLCRGQRLPAQRYLTSKIRGSMGFSVIEHPVRAKVSKRTRRSYSIVVASDLKRNWTFSFRFKSASETALRQAEYGDRLRVLGEFSYSRGLSLDDTAVRNDLPPNFWSLFVPAYLCGTPRCALGDVHWFGVENAKRLGDVRFTDPEFIAQLRKDPAQNLPNDAPAHIEWERKMDEIEDLEHLEGREDPSYGSGATLGTELIRSFRIVTPIFPFGQQHLVFQSRRLLLFLRRDAMNILARIKHYFEDPKSKSVGHLSAERFREVYAQARNLQRASIDEELLLAWHPSQHGAVPLLLKYFDADLLLRLVSEDYRTELSQEARDWRTYVFLALTRLTTGNEKALTRSHFERLPSDEVPNLLHFLEQHPELGGHLRQEEERLELLSSLPFEFDQIPRINDMTRRWPK